MTPIDKLKSEYVSEKEVAEFLGITVASLRNRISKGEFPEKVNGAHLFFIKDIQDYLKKGRSRFAS